MKLIKFELHKLFSHRLFLILFAAAALLNFTFLNYQSYLRKEAQLSDEGYRLLQQELIDKTHEEKGKLIHDAYERVYAIQLIYNVQTNLSSENEGMRTYGKTLREQNKDLYNRYYEEAMSQPVFPYTGDFEHEYALLEQVKNDYEKIDQYQKAIQDILSESDDLQGISIFNQKNSVSSQSITAIQRAYQSMLDTVTDFQIDQGVKALTSVSITDFLAFLLILVAATSVIYEEKEKQLLMLIKSTVNGQITTVASKLAALAITAFLIEMLLYGMNFIYYGSVIGYGNLSASLQSLPLLMLSTLKLNVGTYLLLFLLTKLFMLWMLAVTIFYAAIHFSSIMECMLVTAILFIISLFMSRMIAYDSMIGILKSFNFIALFDTNAMYSTYSQLRFFNIMLDKHIILPLLQLLWIFVFGFLSVFRYLNGMQTAKKENRILVRLNSYQPPIKIHRLFSFELYKVLITNKALLAMIAFALFTVYHFQQQPTHLSFQENYYKEYMEALSGPLTKEKEQFIQSIQKEYEEAEEGLLQIDALVQANKLTNTQANIAKRPYEDTLASKAQFARIEAKVEYVKNHEYAEFVYDSGYHKLLGVQSGINENEMLLLIITMIIVLPVFINEYKSGFILLLHSTLKGRKTLVHHKIMALFLVCSVLYAIYLTSQLAHIGRMYGFPELGASVTSIEYLEFLPHQISISAYIIGFCFIKYVSYLFTVLLIAWIAQRIKQMSAAFIVSLIVCILPYLLTIFETKLNALFPLFNLSWALHHGIAVITITVIVFLSVFLYNNLLRERK